MSARNHSHVVFAFTGFRASLPYAALVSMSSVIESCRSFTQCALFLFVFFILHSVHAFQHFVSFLLRPATQRAVSAGDHAVRGLLTYRRHIHMICGTLLSPTCEEYTARALCSLRSTARRLDCRRSSRYVPRFFGWALWLFQEGVQWSAGAQCKAFASIGFSTSSKFFLVTPCWCAFTLS